MFSSARTLARCASLVPTLPAKLAGLALLLCAAVPASAQTPVVFGGVITDPGVYFLAGNQTGSGGDGISILSDDVTLLLGRFTLRGGGTDVGILSLGNDRLTIWGGRITNFQNAIVMADGTDCTVKDAHLDYCTSHGLFAVAVTESWFSRLQCDHNGNDGVEARECAGSRFVSILAHHNGRNGILLSRELFFAGTPVTTGTKLRLCWAAYNDVDGIRVENTSHHEIVSNQCVNNAEAGIHLATTELDTDLSASQAIAGPEDNLVKSNWCVFNHEGIAVDRYAIDNTLTNNTALASFGDDVVDDNDAPPCANLWFLNFFLTKDGDGEDCIF